MAQDKNHPHGGRPSLGLFSLLNIHRGLLRNLMHAIASDGLPVFLILIGKVPGETHPFTSKRTGIAGKDSQLILQYHMEGNIRNLAFAN